MASFLTLWLTGLCSGYRILDEGDSKCKPRSRSLVERSGAILSRNCFKIEVLGNDIWHSAAPSQCFYNGSIFFNLGVFNLDRPRGPCRVENSTAFEVCTDQKEKSCLLSVVKRSYLATPLRISLTSVSSPIVALSEILPSFHNELSPKTLFLSSPATKFLHLWHICLHFAKRNESMVN